MKFEWKENPSPWSTGTICMLNGKRRVGAEFYDGSAPQGGPKHAATCRLPGIKDNLGHFETAEEAQAMVEKATRYWIKEAGLGEASDPDTG